MLLVSLSKLNNGCGSSLRRFLIGGFKSRGDQFANLCLEGRSLNRNHYIVYTAAVSFSCAVRNPMSVSRSQTASADVYADSLFMGCGDVNHVIECAKPSAVFFGDRSVHSCRKARVSLRIGDAAVSRFASTRWDLRPFFGQCARHYIAASYASYSDGAAADIRDVSLDGAADTPGKHDDKTKKTLKLHSGSCYLPHPDKVATGGEDAHFICEEKRVIGVADGVGGWADVGVDAGVYSRLLMSNSMAAVVEDSEDAVDPSKVLEIAHAKTNVIGSSTACIIALTDQGIHAINLGDSGFIVIRDGSTIFRSPAQQYGFNFPYQLASGNGTEGDLPSSGQVFTFPVASGDVIVAGTDGLFDNLYDNEISTLVVQARRQGLEPHVTAQNIATLAQQRAHDQQRKTPFAAAAHDAGFRYIGGKLDDITVVVSYITGDDNL